MINVKHLLGGAESYAATHDAPDLEKLIGNPTWKQRYVYVRKSVINVTTGLAGSGALILVPEPAAYYVGGALFLLGWIFHYQLPNGPKPPVKDKTGWVAAAAPPPSDAVPPTVDQVQPGDIEPDEAPAVSAEQADAEIVAEDQANEEPS